MGKSVRLVYLSPVPHASFTQRPHKFVEYFNRSSGGRTLWINPYPGRLPKLADLTRPPAPTRRRLPQASSTDSVAVCSVLGCDPLMNNSVARRIGWKRVTGRIRAFVDGDEWLLAIGRPSNLALHLLRTMTPTSSCYDAMDDFPEFYAGLSRRLSRNAEKRIAESVQNILVSSDGLRQKFVGWGHSPEILRNGFDSRWAAEPRNAPKQPVFGYVGTIGAWFDWNLVCRMARELPKIHVDLFGPVRTAVPSLPDNVNLRGECSYGDVPKKLGGFTAGIIPFKINSLTAAVDPIKYYDYRACGLPTISSMFGDMRRHGGLPGVYFVDQHTDYQELLRRVVAAPRICGDALGKFRTENCWDSRFGGSVFFRAQIARSTVFGC